jgi:F0F1-type ATP synthase assembly protein I
MSEDRRNHDQSGTVWSEMGRYAHLGFQLALSTGLFLLGGWWLDGKLGTVPLFTIVGAMAGAAAGFYSMVHQLMRKSRNGSGSASGPRERKH